MLRVSLTSLLLAAALALSGCSFSIGSGDKKTELEKIIRVQLPGEAKEAGLGAISVNEVTCVEKDAERYDCVAEISGRDAEGRPAKRTIPIDGSCDKSECVWKSR
ncbi:MAG: hypothetical protein ACPHCI_01400 [Solirubrobacterales bacterium]